jgi:hypothetical protein
MKKVIRLTEKDLTNIVKRVISEGDDDFVTGVAASKKAEIVQDVIDRIREHGSEYIQDLTDFNSNYEIKRSRNQERMTRRDFELPKGVRVSKSTFPGDM